MNSNEVISRLHNANEVILFGAQAIACQIYIALIEAFQIKPKCFLVSWQENNPANIDGIPVLPLSQYDPINGQLILIATPEPYHEQIMELLSKYDNVNYLCIDSHLEYILLSEYFRKKTSFRLLEDYSETCGTNESSPVNIHILMAKSHVDLSLKKAPENPSWVHPIQVGASLTHKQISSLKDNTGDNISQRNRNYSELTASYWLWKNLRCDYKGIFHYRRVLRFDENNLRRMMCNDIDVVLPLPFVCSPDTSRQYGRYISAEDIQLTFQTLEKMQPDYFRASRTILADKYLYNYNMLIARSEVFDQYCNWLFPLLEAIEQHYTAMSTLREDRYIGYIGELLTALYFLYNRDNLKITHGEKIWFV
ncbi:DUF4422 domain-containing protein [Sporomusa termitida]|uniref:DUF4422 domain-containing protein n=1 Tax=Sporomusa termitida TaxID=2377 RepID=A0A517DXI5_9FIRM|nr:DUF4422 domain-containing protein [Sporomusa termitida]QDR81956.1 hypothetical protein SPTER_33760 [Sporomusa termitida]